MSRKFFIKVKPSNIYWKKLFKNKTLKKEASLCTSNVYYGKYGLKASMGFKLSFKQLESVYKSFLFRSKKKTKLWCRADFNATSSFKGLSSRMGKGKGKPTNVWVANIPEGKILFELSDISKGRFKIILSSIKNRIPVHLKLIRKVI